MAAPHQEKAPASNPQSESLSSPHWNAAEQAEFTKALLTRGVPLNPKTGEYDWELFRVRLGAQRSSAELSTYYNTFLAFCRELVLRHGSSADAKTDANAPPAKEQGVSFETAKSIVLRLMFFFALRSAVLQNPYLDHFLRSAPRPSAAFPNWWTPEYDKALLIGVEHHGLEDTDAICSDPQLPFKAVGASTEPAAAGAPLRPSERVGFPARAEVLKRVELLCKHVQLCSLHSPAPGASGSPPSFALTTPPPPPPSMHSPANPRPVLQSPSSTSLMPPPISPPTRKEKRTTAPVHVSKDETKHQRLES